MFSLDPKYLIGLLNMFGIVTILENLNNFVGENQNLDDIALISIKRKRLRT